MKYHTLICMLTLATSPALAQVTVHEPWVRATVPQQKATGAFMQLSSPKDARLVSASSPVAAVTELHEMTMEKDVMKMRAVPSIEIPAGKGAELKPGGVHIMLMGLKRQIKEGETVPVTLVIDDKTGKRETVEVKAAARPLATTTDGSHGQHKR